MSSEVISVYRYSNSQSVAAGAVWIICLIVLCHLIPYYRDIYGLRSYSGPWLAKYSDLWLGKHAKSGRRSEVVHAMHERYGRIVRIAPNHISIASPEALALIYAHGNGALKSDFYDAFVSIRRGIFTTRDRAEHTRKRKMVSHVFSPKNVLEFEPHIQEYVSQLLRRWDDFGAAEEGCYGSDGEGGWVKLDGRVWFDLLPWVNYLAFDVIGDLAFGSPFGMIQAGKDRAEIPKSTSRDALKAALFAKEIECKTIPAIKILTGRGDFSASMGVLPPWSRPIVRMLIPWYNKGRKDVQALAGIAVTAVAKRFSKRDSQSKSAGNGSIADAETGGFVDEDRVDLLSKLQRGKDEDGKPMGREEVTAEALTLLIAGSDTTSNSICAILYYLAKNISAQEILQQELDFILGFPSLEHEPIPPTTFKRISYLDACINEALRLHSTSSIGLPRVVAQDGLTVLGHYYRPGTVLSVPSYTIHRDKSVWGADADIYRPDRWFEGGKEGKERRDTAFNPFSLGPRACAGKYLAFLELQIVIASVVHRYHVVLQDPTRDLETREGFLRKPVACKVGLKRRDHLG